MLKPHIMRLRNTFILCTINSINSFFFLLYGCQKVFKNNLISNIAACCPYRKPVQCQKDFSFQTALSQAGFCFELTFHFEKK